MDILNNIPQSKFSQFVDKSNKNDIYLKSKAIKWISIIAYLAVIIGSLFTF
ncbi:MAG: hypothetical protein IPM32_17405 [Ignavibacteriae bacterium]|nr:hypothetical protein [Ignavibacteriota bacterium]